MRVVFKIIIGLVLIAGLVTYWFFSQVTDSFSGTYNQIELTSTDNQQLYIKSHNWGVTGDHQLTVIETDKEREFEVDSTKQIIFNGLEPFLYKVSGDTLFLTLRRKSRIPDDFNSTWTIIQKEVDNPTMRKLKRYPELTGI
jgi:hypothetical protein